MYYNPYKLLPGVESTMKVLLISMYGTNDQFNALGQYKMYLLHFFGLISAYNPNVTNKVTVSKTEPALL
jgi:hypothetical protein